MWLWMSKAALAFGIPAVSGAIQVTQPGEVTIGQQPVVTLQVPDAQVVFYTECTPAGSTDKTTVTSPVLEPGQRMELAIQAASPATTAECLLIANFANGLSERRSATVSWTWVEPSAEK